MVLDSGAVVHDSAAAARSVHSPAWIFDRDAAAIAFGWSAALAAVAPFELREPVLRLPGQNISSVEFVLLGGLALWLVALVREHQIRSQVRALAPWIPLLVVAAIAAVLSPVSRINALHMTVRLGCAAAIYSATRAAAASQRRRDALIVTVLASGSVVALLVLADFMNVGVVSSLLGHFRENVAIVGAQVRASGPLQYPTIASMCLEIAFAVGLALVAPPRSNRTTVVIVVALAAIAEAIVVTFTRSGLITLILSLAIVAVRYWRMPSARRELSVCLTLAAVIVAGVLTSRSAEMLMLRLTTEGQGQWFSALIEGPSRVRLDTRGTIDVPLQITNTGRATWDSDSAEPVRLSYHWVARDSDAVVAWEGYRTPFPAPVRPGETVSVIAKVGSAGRPGEFRLMWDIEQERRLWFSTEPGAVLALIPGTVSGSPTGAPPPAFGPRRIPRAAARPGRVVLWRGALAMAAAHPLLGVGPDNYRLAYGSYTRLGTQADPRVHSNNMYLEIVAGTGLAGAAAALWLGIRLARDVAVAWRTSAAGAAVAAACAAIAVHGLADSFISFTATYVLIAVTLGLASAIAHDRHAHSI